MPVALIAAIIAAAASTVSAAAGAAANAAPTSATHYRKERIGELSGTEGAAAQGLTPEQEDELRTLGMTRFSELKGELASHEADALANIPGGATPRDAVLAASKDNANLQQATRAIDASVQAADTAEKNRARQELQELTEKQGRSQSNSRAGTIDSLTSAAKDVTNTVADYAVDTNEHGSGTAENATVAKQLRASGYSDGAIQNILKLPLDTQKEILTLYGIGGY